MVVSGDQWPMLVYGDQEYDSEDPWNGLFRSQILVWVSVSLLSSIRIANFVSQGIQAHFYLTQFSRERGEGYAIR